MSDSATSDLYWQTISDRAAVESFDESDPFRDPLSSIEGTPENASSGIQEYAIEHRDKFLKLTEVLSPENREIIIEYLILRKTEKQIATLHGKKSQSMMGQKITGIVRTLAAAMVLGVNPSIAMIVSIRPSALSHAIYQLGKCRDIARVAGIWKMTPNALRKKLRTLQEELATGGMRESALAEHIRNLLSQSEGPRAVESSYAEPRLLGEFEIDLLSSDAAFLFTGRAGQIFNASKI